MSRAPLVITAVVVEGRPVAEVAAAYGVHRTWVYKLPARYREERPKASYTRFPADLPNQCWQTDFIHVRLSHLGASGRAAAPTPERSEPCA